MVQLVIAIALPKEQMVEHCIHSGNLLFLCHHLLVWPMEQDQKVQSRENHEDHGHHVHHGPHFLFAMEREHLMDLVAMV